MKMLNSMVCVALVSAGLIAGCGEVVLDEEVVEEGATPQEAVSVVPHFTVLGAGDLPDELHIEELGFMISEIRLEPMTGRAGEVAYSAVRPFEVRFDMASGELTNSGDAIELPRKGRYLVSLRLEPVERRTDLGVERLPSFSVSGYVSGAQEDDTFISTRTGEIGRAHV